MSVTISGTGVFTPSQKISNKELVQSYNKYADSYNEEHKISLSTANEVKKSILELNYDLESMMVNPKNFQDRG